MSGHPYRTAPPMPVAEHVPRMVQPVAAYEDPWAPCRRCGAALSPMFPWPVELPMRAGRPRWHIGCSGEPK